MGEVTISDIINIADNLGLISVLVIIIVGLGRKWWAPFWVINDKDSQIQQANSRADKAEAKNDEATDALVKTQELLNKATLAIEAMLAEKRRNG